MTVGTAFGGSLWSAVSLVGLGERRVAGHLAVPASGKDTPIEARQAVAALGSPWRPCCQATVLRKKSAGMLGMLKAACRFRARSFGWNILRLLIKFAQEGDLF